MKLQVINEPSTVLEYNGWIIEIDPECMDWHWRIYPKAKRNDADLSDYIMFDPLPFGSKYHSFQEALDDACWYANFDPNKWDEEEEPRIKEWGSNKYVLIKNIPPKCRKKYKRTPRGRVNYAWSQLVQYRDGYKCQKCGSKTDLESHHVEHYERNPEKRYDLDNGITLCKKCHTEYHKTNGR